MQDIFTGLDHRRLDVNDKGRLGSLLDDDEFRINVPESHTFHLQKLLHVHAAGQDASRPTHRCCTLTQAMCMQAARVVHPRSRATNGEWLEWGWMVDCQRREKST
ncbi:hypothetical protein BKA83DRAFT_4123373 [Pisolithus microcarpus]|nr:hypothetical protein BKA83DRAFT_4123373 [Pisolithus microcarpus]